MSMPQAGQIGEVSTPVEVRFGTSGSQSRVTIFFRFILALPQLIVVGVIGYAAYVVIFLGWFAALVTGRLPAGFAKFLTGYIRWYTRVLSYVYLMHDQYPPFTLDLDASYPVDVAVTTGRLNRLSVLFRIILVIPAVIVVTAVGLGWQILSFVFWIITVVKGQMPDSIFGATAAVLRFQTRLIAYFSMVTSVYPGGLLGDTGPQGQRVDAPVSGTPYTPPSAAGWTPTSPSPWNGTPGETSAPVPPPVPPMAVDPTGLPHAPVPPPPPGPESPSYDAGTGLPASPPVPPGPGTAEDAEAPAPPPPPAGAPLPTLLPPPPTAPPGATGFPPPPTGPPGATGFPPPPAPPGATGFPPPPAPPGATLFPPGPGSADPTGTPAFTSSPADTSGFDPGPGRFWPLWLAKPARTLTIVLIVLGAVGFVAYVGILSATVHVSSIEATVASGEVQAAYNTVGTASQTYANSVKQCGTTSSSSESQFLQCVSQATTTLSGALTQYQSSLSAISYPSSAQADSNAAIAAAGTAVQQLNGLAAAPDLATYQRLSTSQAFKSSLNAVDSTYSQLVNNLNGS